MLPDSTLNIVNNGDLAGVKRFELRAFTNLIRIPTIIWSAFPSLEQIVMANYASVTTLSAIDLLAATKLKYLDLKGNKLTTIPYSTFALAPALETLNLSTNAITEIEGMAFNGCGHLKVLDLSYNKLSLLDAFAFTGLPNLEVLDLSQNKIKLVGDGTFNLPKLRILNANFNAIKLLPDTLFGLPGQAPPLTLVDFGDNKLTHIGASLYYLQELTQLNLTDNKKIDDINLEAFAQLPKLETLFLANSGFRFPMMMTAGAGPLISPPEIAGLPVPASSSPLKNLYLTKNALMNPDVLRQLAYFRQLEVLDLADNKFSFFDVNSLATWFPKLKIIYVGGNKLDCTWLNNSIPVFQAANVNVYTVQKIKTWFGTTIMKQKIIDTDDCFDLEKIFNNILFFINKFSKAVV